MCVPPRPVEEIPTCLLIPQRNPPAESCLVGSVCCIYKIVVFKEKKKKKYEETEGKCLFISMKVYLLDLVFVLIGNNTEKIEHQTNKKKNIIKIKLVKLV